MSRWQEEKKMVLQVARKIFEEGLVIGTSGNVSLRLPPEEGKQLLAITPSAKNYELLNADGIQVIDFEGNTMEGSLPPSVETNLHIAIYRARKNVNAVIHTHSEFASAVSVSGLEIPPIMDDQVSLLGGEIKVAGYAPSGSRELADNVLAALEDRNGVLLANHGVVACGRTAREALINSQLVEKTARIFLLALGTGRVNLLPADAQEAARATYHKIQNE